MDVCPIGEAGRIRGVTSNLGAAILLVIHFFLLLLNSKETGGCFLGIGRFVYTGGGGVLAKDIPHVALLFEKSNMLVGDVNYYHLGEADGVAPGFQVTVGHEVLSLKGYTLHTY